MNKQVLNLLFEVANLERSQINTKRTKESPVLVNLFLEMIPQYYKMNNEDQLFLELIEDVLDSDFF